MGLGQPEYKPIDFSQPQSAVERDVNDRIGEITVLAREAHRYVSAASEKDAKIERMAADMDRLQIDLTNYAAQRAAVASLSPDASGSDAVFRSFTRTSPPADGGPVVRLFGEETRAWADVVGGGVSRKLPGLLDSDTVGDAWHAEVRQCWANLNFLGKRGRHQVRTVRDLLRNAPEAGADFLDLISKGPRSLGLTEGAITKIFSSADSVGGYAVPDEILLPTLSTSGIVSEIPLAYQEFATQSMGSRIDDVQLTAVPTPYLGGAQVADDPAMYTTSTPTLAKISTTPSMLVVNLPIDDKTMADSILSGPAALYPALMRSLMLGVELAWLHGDNGTSEDTSFGTWNPNSVFASAPGGSAASAFRAIKGLRALAFDLGSGATKDLNAFTFANLMALRAQLATPYAEALDLVLMCSARTYLGKILPLEQCATVEKIGPAAAAVNGIGLASINGMRIRTSPMMTNDLDSSGKYTGSGALSALSIAPASKHVVAIQRGMRIMVEARPTKGVTYLVAKIEFARRPIDAETKITTVYGYNIT